MASLSPLEKPLTTVTSTDGTRIWAAQSGCHPSAALTLIFIPGFGCSSLCFVKQFEDSYLKEKFCLITYEPRGQARSGQPIEPDSYSSEKNAQDFKAVCGAFGVNKVLFIGWSFAGVIACDIFAHLGPEWVAGLVFFSAIPWLSMRPEVVHPVVLEVVGPLLTAPDATTLSRAASVFLDTCLYQPNMSSFPHSLHLALAGSLCMQDPEARKLLMTAREQDPTRLLEHAQTLDVFLVMGEHDKHMYWEKMEAFFKKTFAKSEFLLVRDAGHVSFWEKSDQVNKALVKFAERFV